MYFMAEAIQLFTVHDPIALARAGGGGVLPGVCAPVKGMVFKQFTLG